MFVSGLSLTIVTSARGLSCMAVLQAVSILKKERFRGSNVFVAMEWGEGGRGGSGNLGKHPLVNRQACGEREDGKTDTKDDGK